MADYRKQIIRQYGSVNKLINKLYQDLSESTNKVAQLESEVKELKRLLEKNNEQFKISD